MPVDWKNFLSFPRSAQPARRGDLAARGRLGAPVARWRWPRSCCRHGHPSSAPRSAQTPAADAPHAGVLLRTQAEVTLLQPGQTQEVRLYSNVVEVRVTRGSAAADARRARWRARGQRGATACTDQYRQHRLGLRLRSGCHCRQLAPQAPHIVHDRNDNGVEDDGDVRIPLQGPAFTLEPAKPPACWQSPPCPTKRRTDRLPCCACRPDRKRAACSPARTISSSCEGAAFMLHKTADTNRAQGGDVIDYTLDATNNGNADAQGTDTGKDLTALPARCASTVRPPGPCCTTASRRIPGWSAARWKPPSPGPGDSGTRRATHHFPIVPAKSPTPTRWPSRCLPCSQPIAAHALLGARGRRPCRPRRQRRRAELPRRRLARRRARASEQYRARDDRRSRART